MNKYQKPHELTQDILDVLEKHMRAKTISVEAYDVIQARSMISPFDLRGDRHPLLASIREPESDMVLGITIALPESLDKMGLRLPVLGEQMERFYALTQEVFG